MKKLLVFFRQWRLIESFFWSLNLQQCIFSHYFLTVPDESMLSQFTLLRRLTDLASNFSLSLLLAILTISIMLAPMVASKESLLGALFSCLMIVGLVQSLSALTENSHKVRFCLKTAGMVIVVLRVVTEIPATPQWLHLFTLIASMMFQLCMMLILIRHLFSSQPQSEKLLAAINFYLLTGITFSYIYLLVNLFFPGAFDLTSENISSWPHYLYFSFVTLTTLGYGDILPLSYLAQSLVSIEAIIGVLSPTVMIARFVGK